MIDLRIRSEQRMASRRPAFSVDIARCYAERFCGTLEGETLRATGGEANSAGLNGAMLGAPIGGITGSVSAYRYAVKNETNPWNGNFNFKNSVNLTDYNLTPDPLGDNVTLYRGTTGSEKRGGALFMTENPDYAATFVKNGGKVVKVTISRGTIDQMYINGDLLYLNGLHLNNKPSIEYKFSPQIKHQIVDIYK